MMKAIGKLHVLTDTSLQSRYSHEELARLAIAGGADTIQFRQKTGSTREMIETAGRVKPICAKAGVTFIVNDRLDVALAVKADGVHLGRDDFPIALARVLLPEEAIIGGSADSLTEVKQCLADGADYVGFGPVFATTSKDNAGWVKGVETLKEIVEAARLPIIAIGGIGLENVQEAMRAGPHGVAVISAVCCQDDPEQAAGALVRAMSL